MENTKINYTPELPPETEETTGQRVPSGEEISAAVREASDYAADYISGKK